jgi:hypothetical protein
MVMDLIDPRDEALRKALYESVWKLSGTKPSAGRYVDFTPPVVPSGKAPLDRG